MVRRASAPGCCGRTRSLLAAASLLALLAVPAAGAAQAAGRQPAGAGRTARVERLPSAPSPGKVTIYRDDWGVPHLYAATEEDGYYGLGYAQAEDQLETILTLFLMARGELAGAFGHKAVGAACAALGPLVGCDTDLAQLDLVQREWMHAEEARRGFARLDPQLQKNYRAYVAGMERYLADHPAERPAWAPELEPSDPVALSRALLWLGFEVSDGLQDCRRGGVRLAAAVDAALRGSASLASNEWVLAPWRTADQATIVLSDPHGGIDGGFVYEFRMHAGGLELAGYGVGAMPLLVHNRRVSWGMTTGAPDVSDCYEVEVDPRDSLRYAYDGESRTMVTRPVTVAVKGGSPVTRTFAYTRHNGVLSPVVARKDGKAYVVSTTYMDQAGRFDEEVYRMAHARDVGELRAAMESMSMFPQNVMAGDSHGGSIYVRAGRAPLRPAGYDWTRPVPGNTSKTAWLGVRSLDDLVQLRDPAQGYMQNDNVSPDRMLEGSPLTADRYPPDVYNDRPGRTNTRALRTVEVLSRAWNFSVSDAIDLSLDEKWYGTERWQQALARALDQNVERARRGGPEFRRFVDRILGFDGQARAGSMAARAYYAWREALWSAPQEAAVDTLGDALDSTTLPADLAMRLLDGADRAIASLHRLHGTIDVRLGDDFRIGRDRDSFPLGGASLLPTSLATCGQPGRSDRECTVTLRAMTFGAPDSLGRRYAALGSRILRLVVFTEPLQSFTLHNYGQSTRPGSAHYMDQARLSSQRRLKPTYFESSELAKHVVSERTLDVRLPPAFQEHHDGHRR